jgi:hypothetical protein
MSKRQSRRTSTWPFCLRCRDYHEEVRSHDERAIPHLRAKARLALTMIFGRWQCPWCPSPTAWPCQPHKRYEAACRRILAESVTADLDKANALALDGPSCR